MSRIPHPYIDGVCCMGFGVDRVCAGGVSWNWSAKGDRPPSPLWPVPRNGAGVENASTSKGVLKSCAHSFDGFILALGIAQVELPAIERGRIWQCETEGGDGCAWLKFFQSAPK